MTERRFDGRVIAITGAGRGLGFEYARLLAARGARIVINDNGSALDGSGGDSSVAQQAVDRIKAEGGEAVACTASVATPEGGKAIIEAALDSWGRIDGLIHNAGNTRFDNFAEITAEEFRSVVDVHLMGAFHVTHAAFPHMVRAGFGRVVLTGSIGGLYTMPQTVGYSVSKSGMIGLSNLIALEGAYPPMTPDMVAPVVGYLVHEDCAVTAELYVAMAGRVARAYVSETRGVYRPDWTIDAVAENLDAIRAPEDGFVFHPAEGGFFAHMTESFAMARGT